MTDNIDKIVQEAECVAAADEYFKARTWLMDTNDNRRIFEAGFDRAYALLSKLRAPVADEREMSLAVALHFADFPRPYHTLEAPADTNGELYRALAVLAREYRAALASAPVAGEAQQRVAYTDSMGHLHWTNGRRILVSLYAAPQASEAVRMEAGLWLAIGAIEELTLQYRLKYDTEGCNSYHEGGADALDEAEAAIRALLSAKTALSAQPGAQKEQSDA